MSLLEKNVTIFTVTRTQLFASVSICFSRRVTVDGGRLQKWGRIRHEPFLGQIKKMGNLFIAETDWEANDL